MIQANVSKCRNLEEFYKEIRNQQETAHGPDYCRHHDAIKNCIVKMNCSSYKELGTHQGATAAAACLANPNILQSIELVDTSFDLFNKHSILFEGFCTNHKINISKIKIDSSDPRSAVNPIDLLLVDSLHTPEHLRKELLIHPVKVQKFMIFHDTEVNGSKLFKVLENFVKNNSCWSIFEHYPNNVGYTILKRVKNEFK